MQGIERTRLVRRVWLAGMAAVICAASVTAAEQQDDKAIVIDGSTTVGPIAKAFRDYYGEQHPEVTITVSESGSGNGAKSLINGACQVAAMSRFMKETELKAANARGIIPVPHVVAMDGIAVVVHPSNPVANLTVAQVRDIYLGKISNWNQVGGPDKAIVKISRDTNSGTYETFEELVMDKGRMASDTEYVGSNGQARARVQATPTAIGFVGLGFVDRTLKALSINGVPPAQKTVASGKYPIGRPLFLFTNGYPKLGSPLHQFVTLHLTRVGEEIVRTIGFVPVTEYMQDETEAKAKP